jgi:hypothetical protein
MTVRMSTVRRVLAMLAAAAVLGSGLAVMQPAGHADAKVKQQANPCTSGCR